MSLVNLERDGALAVITIDNPPQNRITEQMSSEFLAVLDTIEADEVRALLLTTKGPDFSFGGDIMPWPEVSNRQLRAVFERHMTVFNPFERLPIPVVAAVQGLCFGGGLELAIRADIIIAGETSRFGHPEQSLGIIHGARRRLPRRRACGPRLRLPVADDLRAGAGRDHASAGRGQSGRARRGLAVDGRNLGARLAQSPTRAYAAHKALLRIWAESGVAAADSAMFDIAMPFFETEDVRRGLPSAIEVLKAGRPRPPMDLKGR